VNGEFINLSAPDEPSYRVYAIFEDREGNLWVGSEEGLARLTPKRFRTITKKDGLTLNTVVTVCASRDGSVWISAWGGGLNHWQDGRITLLNKSNGLSSDFVMAMTEGRDGSLWAGTDYGSTLNRIQNGRITFLGREQGFVASVTTALLEDDQGRLWMGSRDSLQCWDGEKFTKFTTKEGLSNNRINALCGSVDGGMWVGTDNGLTRGHDGQFENLAAKNPALQAQILSLYEDSDKTLWIGTKGRGLLRWRDGTVDELTSRQGLFSDTLYSILEDSHGNLWLNSSRGIFRLSKAQAEEVAQGRRAAVTSISYGKADGILSSGQYRDVTQPASCKSTDGRLWFRTTQGVAVVNPEEITTNELPPPVVIQEIVADKRPVQRAESATGDAVMIQPGRGELEIQYAALSFRAPEKNQYRYKLEGVDPNWVDAGSRRVALYNNLRPGRYRFQVTACNNDGVWSMEGASVALKLEPHFWQTWWFLSLVVAAAIGLVGGTARYVTRRRMQRKLERLEQQNAIEKERSRIARDMHDELGAKLTRISFQGATASRRLSNPAEAEQHIKQMSKTARELVLSLDQIVWAVDPENDSLENLANYICRYASEFLENSPMRCEFAIPTKLPNCRLSTEVRHNIFLAVKEALNNALKHSGATCVVLSISVRDREFEISVADDGCGIGREENGEPGKFKRAGRGLTNLRERLVSIRGKFELDSAAGRGTKVRLLVPLSAETDRVSSIHPTRNSRL
jgi:signal transduction histidine kinase